jgi:hypothetical protein
LFCEPPLPRTAASGVLIAAFSHDRIVFDKNVLTAEGSVPQIFLRVRLYQTTKLAEPVNHPFNIFNLVIKLFGNLIRPKILQIATADAANRHETGTRPRIFAKFDRSRKRVHFC